MFPNGVVTVAFPLSSTTTVAPGFTALTLSSMAFFSASVSFSGFATTVLSAGLTTSLPAFGLAGASVSGVELGSLTVTLTGTSSLDPSGYVTTTVASFSPGVAVSTGSLKATFVPLGRSFTFPIESSAFGVVPLFTVCVLAVGSFLSASVGFLVTNSDNGFLSLEPSL